MWYYKLEWEFCKSSCLKWKKKIYEQGSKPKKWLFSWRNSRVRILSYSTRLYSSNNTTKKCCNSQQMLVFNIIRGLSHKMWTWSLQNRREIMIKIKCRHYCFEFAISRTIIKVISTASLKILLMFVIPSPRNSQFKWV